MLIFQILYYWLVFGLRGIPSSRAKLMRTNEKRLRKKLQWVVQHIPFYQGINPPTLNTFPVISKATFNVNFSDLNVANVPRDEAYGFALRAEQTGQFRAKLHGLTVGLSTGTSGNRGVFLVTNKEIAQWVAMIFVRVLRLNPVRRQRIAFVFRTNSNLYQATNVGAVTMRFFSLDLDNPAVLNDLTEFNPTTLVAQPSALIRLANYKKRAELSMAPNRVISIAEVLTSRDRDYLTDVFGTIIHQVYQCMEGFLAHTCELGNLHVNEDIIHWEKRYLDSDQCRTGGATEPPNAARPNAARPNAARPEKRRYHPILTDFTRQTQALIRYELNDILVEPDAPCLCGSPFTHIGQIEGRADDVLVFSNQSGQSVAVFPDLVRRAVCDSSDVIVSYAVYQLDYKVIYVYLDKTLLPDITLCQHIQTNLIELLARYGVSGVSVSFFPYNQREPETKLRRVKRNPLLTVHF